MNIPENVIQKAQEYAKVEAEIVIDPQGIAIVKDNNGKYRYYNKTDWEEPHIPTLLPWHPPRHLPIAFVDQNGNVTFP